MFGQTSNGSEPIYGDYYGTVSYPPSTVGGTIKVRGYGSVSGCSAEIQYSKWSDPVTITRDVEWELTANRSSFLCGDTDPILFTVSPKTATPDVSCAVYYWNNSTTATTSNTFSISPGVSDLIVTVKIVYGGQEKLLSLTVPVKAFDEENLPDVLGPSAICTSGTFTLSSLPEGATVTWDESSNLIENPTGTFTANGSGEGWVEATLTNDCGEITLPRKSFPVGLPVAVDEIQEGIYYYQDYCPYGYYTFTASNNNSSAYTSYSWSMSYHGYITQGQGTNSVVVYLDTPGDAWISVQPRNACGWATGAGLNFEVESCAYGMMVYPNPAKDELTLTLDEDVKLDEDAVYEITDNYNTKLVANPLKEKEKKINVSSLKKGLYYISVYNNGKLTTKKFIKE